MEIFDRPYFVINKILMKVVGVWPDQDLRVKTCIRSILISFMTSALISQVLAMFKADSFDILFQRLGIIVVFVRFMSKYGLFILFTNMIKTLFNNVALNWKMIIDENERNILIQYSKQARFISLIYMIYTTQSAITYVLFPMAIPLLDQSGKRPRILIFDGEMFVDKELHYYKIYTYEVIESAIIVVVSLAFDTTLAVIIEHALGLLAIIKYRLKTFTKHVQPGNMDKLSNDVTYELLVDIIKMHKEVIKFIDLLQSSLSKPLLLLIVMNLMALTVTSIIIIINLHDNIEIIRHGMILVGMMIHLFFFSWPGQKVIDHSLELFDNSYNNQWYDCTLKVQRTLTIFTLRCFKPCTLSACGLYILNFQNFLTIMNTAMSYITVLSSFR